MPMRKWYEESEWEELQEVSKPEPPPEPSHDFILVGYVAPRKVRRTERIRPKLLPYTERKAVPAVREVYLPAVIYKLPEYEPKRQVDWGPVINWLYERNYNQPLWNIHMPTKPMRVLNPATDYDWSLAIAWLILPKWKRLWLYLRFRYGLLQKAISADYENPTFARMTTDGISLLTRWFIRGYRYAFTELCDWVRYYVRKTYKHFIGDTVQIIQAVVLCALAVLLSFSYISVADIYTETNTLTEFGHSFNVKSVVQYELGDPVILDPIYFLEDDSIDYANRVRIKSDLITSDQYRYDEETHKVRGYGITILPSGEYTVELNYGDQVRQCTIVVEDTTPPDLSECDLYNQRSLRVHKGTQVLDIRGMLVAGIHDVSLLETRRYDTGSLSVITDTDNLDTSEKGTYTIEVHVEDKYGNKTEVFPVRVQVV